MKQALLTFNAGSSSIKFGLYERDSLTLLCRGQISNIGADAVFTVDGTLAGQLGAHPVPLPRSGDHDALTHWLLGLLDAALVGIEVCAAGHRVVHGGPEFAAPTRLTPAVVEKLMDYSALAPNHQPHNLAPIRSVAATWPRVIQYACFDTAFHRTQPRVAELFALPRELSDAGIIRYGFHGLSYAYIAGVLPDIIGDRAAAGKVIVAHLGHGASLCAMVDRRSVGTSMGFTALDGLMMGKRCGALDPGVVLHLVQHHDMDIDEVSDVLMNKSGLLGVSGISDDVRELLASDTPQAAEAIDLFVYRAVRELGALIASIGGLDTLVFTAGIGERSAVIRERIAQQFTWLGVDIDIGANVGQAPIINSARSKVNVLAIPTNEEIVIAEAAAEFIERGSNANVSRDSGNPRT